MFSLTQLVQPAGLLRAFALILPLALAACNTTAAPPPPVAAAPAVDPVTAERYAAVTTDKHPVPGVDPTTLKPRNVRQLVDYATTEKPGTIVVDTDARFIYLVQEGGKALRYGVGVGKEGLEFKGTATVARKAQWPRWTPTPDMIRREPERYKKWAGGMEGGTDNPLGARALYLFKGGKDTLYRIHGTNEPETIGEAVSSGCIRMMNQDVIDLYSRVPTGAKVVVL
ncbi:L,D-transpeptidase family protein [Microvirga makkahensis]|uniref:L,D-transpeptidase family protein n=1 Tax=Microvirga makkahensis TaxID=1128670 RepID=A0A7X3MS86_9HYPH|nr:L,D-transpeptidase [Microvirga makkahensis]MXQ12282.1 L,D-transpeptidase family protein [Microvirga makkahensis]